MALESKALSSYVCSNSFRNGVVRILLNRGSAMNAVNRDMANCISVELQLRTATTQDRIGAIVLDSSSPRAFCAGGDIKAAREAVLASQYAGIPPPDHEIHRIFQAEYALICQTGKLQIPVISLCDGVWMGFGVGLAAFGSARVVTERTIWAMPENSIGLWPDVGFALLAARMPWPAVGLHLALTGHRLTCPTDLLHLGIATHYVHSSQLQPLRDALFSDAPLPLPPLELLARSAAPPTPLTTNTNSTAATNQTHQHTQHHKPNTTITDTSPPTPSMPLSGMHSSTTCPSHSTSLVASATSAGGPELVHHAPALSRWYGPALCYNTRGLNEVQALQQLMDALHQASSSSRPPSNESESELAGRALSALTGACPYSLALTLRHYAAVAAGVAQGAASPLSTLEGVMQAEYGIAVRTVGRYDFVEGVRAAVVDKDRRPQWQPSQLSQLDLNELHAAFKPLPEGLGLRVL